MKCECCDKENVEVIIFEDKFYCRECYDKLTIECENCGRTIKVSDACITEEGNIICDNCYDDYFRNKIAKIYDLE